MNESLRQADPAPGTSRERGWSHHRPEPRSLWIRHRPRRWPTPDAPFVDLATGALVYDTWGGSDGGPWQAPDLAGLEDVVYLPPSAPEQEAQRRRLADRAAAAGLPLLLQAIACGGGEKSGDRELAAGGERALLVADLTRHLLSRDAADEDLGGVEGAVAAIPLLPGLVDPRRFARLAAALAGAGARGVHLAPVVASPAVRRRLAAHLEREEDYRALFHAPPLEERELGRIAAEHGLATAVPRPLPAAPRRLRSNRFLAGLLAEAGDLWTRLEPGGREAAPFFRAARFVDETPHDLEGLARDGNLRVLEWLEPAPRDLVEESLREGRSSLVEELRGRWLGEGGRGAARQ